MNLVICVQDTVFGGREFHSFILLLLGTVSVVIWRSR